MARPVRGLLARFVGLPTSAVLQGGCVIQGSLRNRSQGGIAVRYCTCDLSERNRKRTPSWCPCRKVAVPEPNITTSTSASAGARQVRARGCCDVKERASP
jgi:hypothetical protein